MTSEFGNRLKKYREDLTGLSQTKIAQQADMNPSYWTRLESGERVPSEETLETIMSLIDIPEEEKDDFILSAGLQLRTQFSDVLNNGNIEQLKKLSDMLSNLISDIRKD